MKITEIPNLKPGQGEIRAMFMPGTFSDENRTVDVVFATETKVRRMTWDGAVDEVLVVDSSAMDLTRFNSGANVLDNHDRWGSVLESVLGVVVQGSARIEGREAVCKVRFAQTEEGDRCMSMVKDGILRNTSVGYKVHEYQVTKREGYPDEYRAVSWEPYELSFVSVPADSQAQVRGEGQTFLNSQNRSIMNDNPVTSVEEPSSPNPVTPAASDSPANPTATPLDAAAVERTRASNIIEQVRIAGLDAAVASEMITRGLSASDAALEILNRMGSKTKGQNSQNPDVTASTNAVSDDHRRSEDMQYGILLRAGEGSHLSEEQRTRGMNYRSMRLLDIATLFVGDTRGLAVTEIATRAFAPSSQFPVILEGVLNQTLLVAYRATPDTWREFCRTGSLGDFRISKRKQTGSLASLEVINENGEIKAGGIEDGEAESIYLESFGKLIGITRKALINDDLGAFTRLAGDLGRAAARTIEEKVYEVLLSNPTMGDNVALFHAATHGNYVASGSGGVVTVSRLDAARVAMSLQKDINGRDYLDIRPYILLCSTSQGGQARVVNAAQYDIDLENKFQVPNRVQGLFAKVIDTPRITGNRWYCFADPTLHPVLEVAFLDGVQTPYLEMQDGFEIDGKRWKIRLDFGVGAIGWRGAYLNYGS